MRIFTILSDYLSATLFRRPVRLFWLSQTRALRRTLLFFGTLLPLVAPAQGLDRFVEFFTLHPNREAARQDSLLYPSKLILTPLVAFSPETNLEFGVGAKYLFKFRKSGPETRTSNMPLSLTYTLNNQILLFSGFEIFSNQEKFMLTGNARFKVFPQRFYGIGRDSPESAEEEYSFSQLLLEPILLKQVGFRHLFLGAGVRYNRVSNVTFEAESVLAQSGLSGARGSTSVGAELALVYDSRDNILTAHRGWYTELTHGFYGKVLGGTHRFQLTRLDLRKFIPLARRQTLAFQFLASFSFQDVPLAELSALGGDDIMRGYYAGRYLDSHLLALQAEYRFRLYQRLGAVVFAGGGDVAQHVREFAFGNIRPTVGVGLRFLIDKTEDLNLRFDYGFGRRTQNYYLQLAEAF